MGGYVLCSWKLGNDGMAFCGETLKLLWSCYKLGYACVVSRLTKQIKQSKRGCLYLSLALEEFTDSVFNRGFPGAIDKRDREYNSNVDNVKSFRMKDDATNQPQLSRYDIQDAMQPKLTKDFGNMY